MNSDRVIGQVRVKKTLQSSLDRNLLAHAYLFYGQTGVGKDAMAVSMAMGLSCSKAIVGGCGSCSICQSILRLEYPGFHLILSVPTKIKSMSEAKYREIVRERALQKMKEPYSQLSYMPEISTQPVIGINQIRSMKREVMLKLAGGRFRVFLLSQAHLMTIPAANSLLKLLEEPPPGTIIFLTTSLPGKLLPTIVSRCQAVRFDSLKEEEVENVLIDQYSVQSAKAKFIARMSGGSLRRAFELTEEKFDNKREAAITFLEITLSDKDIEIIEYIENFLREYDKYDIKEILHILLVWFRDILHMQKNKSDLLMNVDCKSKLELFLNKYKTFDIGKGIAVTERAIDFIEKNVYLQLVVFGLSQDLKNSYLT